jgi:hypothetical protein
MWHENDGGGGGGCGDKKKHKIFFPNLLHFKLNFLI